MERELRALFALLETGEADPRSIEAVAAESAAAFDRLRAIDPRAESEEERAAVEAAADEVLRLNAVALSLLQREFNDVQLDLKRATEGRRQLSYYSPTGATGESCNVSA